MTWVQVACSQLLSKPRWRKPTSTSQSRTFSPSSFKLNLIVPCVAGWEGPIWSSMVSRGRSVGSAFIEDSRRSGAVSQLALQPQQFVLRPLIDEGPLDLSLRNPRLAQIHRIILPQRVPLKFLIEKDTAKI